MKRRILPIVATVLVLFGAVTLFMNTAVILDLFGIWEKEGNYVPFVVGVNFVCSLLALTSVLTLLGYRAFPATRHHSPPGTLISIN